MFGKKAQASTVDALLFLSIAAGASTLLFYIAGLYSGSTNAQIQTIYTYEWAQTAMISLHYAKDSGESWFWEEGLKEILGDINDPGMNYLNVSDEIRCYLSDNTANCPSRIHDKFDTGSALGVWVSLMNASPSASPFITFCLEDSSTYECTTSFICFNYAGSLYGFVCTPSDPDNFWEQSGLSGKPQATEFIEKARERPTYSSSARLRAEDGSRWLITLELHY
jgi:hypothetical protein